MTTPELLAPAGTMDKLRTCLLYGADAVYLGGSTGNLRAAAKGFDLHNLKEAVRLAEAWNARIYYCLNSLPMQSDLSDLPRQLEEAAQAKVHGLIIADPGVLRLARQYAPGISIHLSTQANTTNSEALAFWEDCGVERINLARELTCRDIHALRKAQPRIELEVFVHGSMCLAVSGQCLLSAWLNARSGNQGRCTQPCRFEYKALGLHENQDVCEAGMELVVEEYTRPGEQLWSVRQDERYSSFWAPQDLCLLPWLPWLLGQGINALKIEGRMKSAGWLAHMVDAYRTGLDFLAGRAKGQGEPSRLWSYVAATCMQELFIAATRQLCSGFFLHGRRRNLTQELLDSGLYTVRPNRSGESALPELGHQLLAVVVEPAGPESWVVDLRGNWSAETAVQVLLPGLRRPVIAPDEYGLENTRGERTSLLGNGVRGVLHMAQRGLEPGIFIRSMA